MAKYLLAYHGGSMPETKEAQDQVMAAWGVWFGQLGSALVDGGLPTRSATTINADGSVSAGGGANPVTGYSIINVDSTEGAIAAAKMCPILGAGASIEIDELFEVM